MTCGRLLRWRHALEVRLRDDSGNAAVEFVGLAVVLLIPLVYLVLTLGQVQAASFAADTAARQVVRVVATEPDEGRQATRTESIIRMVSRDYGVGIGRDAVHVSCSEHPCSSAGAVVRVDVDVSVDLPGLGSLGVGGGIVEVTSSHALRADENVQKVVR